MARSQDSYNKKEREKKRRKKKQDKRERREQRKAEKVKSGKKSFEDMITYQDEYGNLSSTPPDPIKKTKVKAEDIVLGVPPQSKTPSSPIRKGLVKFFIEEKGYGFITDVETQENVFVHINNLEEAIQENDEVTFEVEMGPKGPNAVKVSLVNE